MFLYYTNARVCTCKCTEWSPPHGYPCILMQNTDGQFCYFLCDLYKNRAGENIKSLGSL